MRNAEVTYRSEIKVEPHRHGFRYRFNVTLDTGENVTFENYAATYDTAMTAGIRRSERIIEKGYPNGDLGGLTPETFGTRKI